MKEQQNPPVDDGGTIEGRHAVSEALRAGRTIDKLLVAEGKRDRVLYQIVDRAKQAGIVVQTVDVRRLDQLSQTGAHQGLVAFCAQKDYAELDDLFELAQSRGEDPFFLLCDEIGDPHNLGAMLRTADAAGAHGIIIPKRRSVGLNATVAKAAAGALEHVPVVRVGNLSDTVRKLKDRGLWICGADGSANTLYDKASLTGPLGLVIGSEGGGIGRLLLEQCDFTVRLPMQGQLSSLNASVAAGILMYEVLRQRRG